MHVMYKSLWNVHNSRRFPPSLCCATTISVCFQNMLLTPKETCPDEQSALPLPQPLTIPEPLSVPADWPALDVSHTRNPPHGTV